MKQHYQDNLLILGIHIFIKRAYYNIIVYSDHVDRNILNVF